MHSLKVTIKVAKLLRLQPARCLSLYPSLNKQHQLSRMSPYDDNNNFFSMAANLLSDLDREFGAVRNRMLNNLGAMNQSTNAPWPSLRESTADDLVSTDSEGNRHFDIAFDMKGFKPEEIKLRTENGHLIVHAKKEKSSNGDYFLREFSHSYRLPADLKLENLKSKWTDDNILCIEAEMPKQLESSGGSGQQRTIQIEHGDASPSSRTSSSFAADQRSTPSKGGLLEPAHQAQADVNNQTKRSFHIKGGINLRATNEESGATFANTEREKDKENTKHVFDDKGAKDGPFERTHSYDGKEAGKQSQGFFEGREKATRHLNETAKMNQDLGALDGQTQTIGANYLNSDEKKKNKQQLKETDKKVNNKLSDSSSSEASYNTSSQASNRESSYDPIRDTNKNRKESDKLEGILTQDQEQGVHAASTADLPADAPPPEQPTAPKDPYAPKDPDAPKPPDEDPNPKSPPPVQEPPSTQDPPMPHITM